LSKNDVIQNIEYLNEYKNILNTVDIRISTILNEEFKTFAPQIKFIENKEKYYDRVLFIEHKKKSVNCDKQDETPFNFENNFDNVEEKRIYNYFNDSLVQKGHLSKEDLEKYILLAFQDKKAPEEKLILQNVHIGNITNVFYTYYREISLYKQGEQEKYAQLLGNYFKSFNTEKVVNNFARNYQTVRK
jgi:hypothetical protein